MLLIVGDFLDVLDISSCNPIARCFACQPIHRPIHWPKLAVEISSQFINQMLKFSLPTHLLVYQLYRATYRSMKYLTVIRRGLLTRSSSRDPRFQIANRPNYENNHPAVVMSPVTTAPTFCGRESGLQSYNSTILTRHFRSCANFYK